MKYLDWLMLFGIMLMATALMVQCYVSMNKDNQIKTLRRDNATLMGSVK